MRDRSLEKQVGELFDMCSTFLHVDGYVGVGHGHTLVSSCFLSFCSAHTKTLKDRCPVASETRAPPTLSRQREIL